MQHSAIVGSDLTIIKGNIPAVRSASFRIPPGTITGLIGPSGSGKTTLLRAIVGAQRITSGTLQVLDAPAGSASLRSRIGYVTQAPAVYNDLTVVQNLRYFAAMLNVSAGQVEHVIQLVDLLSQRRQLVGSLSGGQQARVSLAVALLGEPPLLVLDEPTVGLDPVLRRSLWSLFKSIADSGRTLLISSHVMDEAEQCAELLLLRDGGVLYQGSRQGLLTHTRTRSVEEAFLALAGGAHES